MPAASAAMWAASANSTSAPLIQAPIASATATESVIRSTMTRELRC